jgi:WD40 repeat protein
VAQVRLWEVSTGKPLGPALPITGRPVQILFSADGQHVLIEAAVQGFTSRRGSVQVISARNGLPLSPAVPYIGSEATIGFAGERAFVVHSSGDASVRLWQTPRADALAKPLQALAHPNWVTSARFSPDGHSIVTGCVDGIGRLWDVRTGVVRHELKHQNNVWDVAFSPDGRGVLSGSHDRTAQLWNAETGRLLVGSFPHDQAVWAVAISPDGRFAATGPGFHAPRPAVRLWDAHTGIEVGEPLVHELRWSRTDSTRDTPNQHAGIRRMAFNPAGDRLLVGLTDGTARVWDLSSRRPACQPLVHGADVRSVAFHPAGQVVVSGGEDGVVRWWNVVSGEQLGDALQLDDAISSLDYSPDGKMLLVGCHDGAARLYDFATRRIIGRPLRHAAGILAVDFSSDGRFLLTAGQDRLLNLWKAPLPVDGSPEAVRTFAEARTGMELSISGATQLLSAEEWNARHSKLETKP